MSLSLDADLFRVEVPDRVFELELLRPIVIDDVFVTGSDSQRPLRIAQAELDLDKIGRLKSLESGPIEKTE